jgi:hypothetical protein
MSNAFRLSLAPDKLWQQIDPWKFYLQGAQFGFINIDLGNTQHPELEQKILDEVGSYGRQLGHIGDALEVIMRHLDRSKFTKEEKIRSLCSKVIWPAYGKSKRRRSGPLNLTQALNRNPLANGFDGGWRRKPARFAGAAAKITGRGCRLEPMSY